VVHGGLGEELVELIGEVRDGKGYMIYIYHI
jgi:hypothetical protein